MEAGKLGKFRRGGLNDSPWISVFNLCNAAIGAGVLSFPFGFRETGVLGGLFFTGVIWVVEVAALCLLVRVAEKNDSKTYQQLVHSVLGSRMAVISSITMFTFLVGSMISYLIITGDVFQPILGDYLGNSTFLANRRVIILFFATVVILPLSLKTTLKDLKWSSMLSVIMLTYLTVALVSIGIFHMWHDGFPDQVTIFEGGTHAFIIMDIVVFAFQCHIQVVPIFAELSDHPHFFWEKRRSALEEELLDEEIIIEDQLQGYRSERVHRMDGVIFLSMSVCFIGYCLVGEFGYLIFPNVESDILKSFGNTNIFMNFARIGMAVVAMVCYPVQHHPARSIVDDAVRHILHIPSDSFSWARHVLITLAFFGATLAASFLISDLGTVFSIVGSTGGVMVVFIVPGILLVKGSHLTEHGPVVGEDEVSPRRSTFEKWIQVLAGSFALLLGAVIFIATAYVTAAGLVR